MRTLSEPLGQQAGSPGKIAHRLGFIGRDALHALADLFRKNQNEQNLEHLDSS
ncbi:hypothetical protein [Limimaricola sp.]|uniref:hypothetical protein n=1 Tax=Limimaricola sp. TaxID=2211665 RepID=UPI0025C3230E|nr:hypothetical protein [Limimaricola sp.]